MSFKLTLSWNNAKMWKEVGLGCSWLYQPGLSKVSDKIGPAGFLTYRHHLIYIIIDYEIKLLSVYKLGDKSPGENTQNP